MILEDAYELSLRSNGVALLIDRRPWETEGDPEIKSQLRVLDMKRLAFGERHAGTHTTLGRLGGLCRAAGRLEVGGCCRIMAGGRRRGGEVEGGERGGGARRRRGRIN